MNKPILSILIPSIPERNVKAKYLFDTLQGQINKVNANSQVEILSVCDNLQMSIGKKRDILVQIASGKYVAFVDDDDSISETYIEDVLKAAVENNYPDLIMFDSMAILNGKEARICVGINNPNDEVVPNGEGGYKDTKRKPFHVCAWSSKIAKTEHFPDNNYGEDWVWCAKLLPKVKTHVKIDKVLHVYRFDNELTRASL